MAKDNINRPFSNGFWIWDDAVNALAFISREIKETPGLLMASGSSQPSKKTGTGQIRFKDTVDALEMAQFRRQYQRRVKPNEPQIVTIQDIKDAVLFTAERQDLTPEFIEFMHTKEMDEFLRTLIVYFQYYFQVWDNLLLRREEARRKLRQPIVTVLENIVRDDLADLRSMVARNYGYIILGIDDTFPYYHMGNRNNVSLSDKDRHLHECLLSTATRIVWIALLRKNFSLIGAYKSYKNDLEESAHEPAFLQLYDLEESYSRMDLWLRGDLLANGVYFAETELNRLFRTEIFNMMTRIKQSTFHTNAEERRVLLGKANTLERKLKHRSPAVQELIYDDHSYKMLAIGKLRVKPVEDRIAYLEVAYTAPEELLFELEIGVGILGLSKNYLTPMLMPKEGMAKKIHVPPFKLPEMKEDINACVGEYLPADPPQYPETAQAKSARKTQCTIWRRYAYGLLVNPEDMMSLNIESISGKSRLLSYSDTKIEES